MKENLTTFLTQKFNEVILTGISQYDYDPKKQDSLGNKSQSQWLCGDYVVHAVKLSTQKKSKFSINEHHKKCVCIYLFKTFRN